MILCWLLPRDTKEDREDADLGNPYTALNPLRNNQPFITTFIATEYMCYLLGLYHALDEVS